MPWLPEIAVPVRLIFGEQDTITPRELADEMRRHLPHADITIVPESGHLSNLETPELFNGALAAYLARLHRPDSP